MINTCLNLTGFWGGFNFNPLLLIVLPNPSMLKQDCNSAKVDMLL